MEYRTASPRESWQVYAERISTQARVLIPGPSYQITKDATLLYFMQRQQGEVFVADPKVMSDRVLGDWENYNAELALLQQIGMQFPARLHYLGENSRVEDLCIQPGQVDVVVDHMTTSAIINQEGYRMRQGGADSATVLQYVRGFCEAVAGQYAHALKSGGLAMVHVRVIEADIFTQALQKAGFAVEVQEVQDVVEVPIEIGAVEAIQASVRGETRGWEGQRQLAGELVSHVVRHGEGHVLRFAKPDYTSEKLLIARKIA